MPIVAERDRAEARQEATDRQAGYFRAALLQSIRTGSPDVARLVEAQTADDGGERLQAAVMAQARRDLAAGEFTGPLAGYVDALLSEEAERLAVAYVAGMAECDE